MLLYNTLAKNKEELKPRKDKKIQMFVCGPTVYDYIHIGNARTFVFFDVVAKYLRSQKYEVDYIQNITDIDDKIIARAKESNREPLEYAKEYYKKFRENMEALGVDSPKYIPATEHIEQVIKQVKTLIDKGHAYLIENDGYYFDLSTFKDYGKLSGRKSEMADDAVTRIDENEKKKNKGDFCLWKLSREGESSWDFETGKFLGIVDAKTDPAFAKASAGRPGWHIEDTAITEHYFGPQYDIHGGGQDLIFPHHEAEITQQESASGLKPFVKYWMHIAFLINHVKSPDGDHVAGKAQKMSKSVGNFETVNALLEKYPKEVLRFYLLSGHYRQPLEFSDKTLKQSQAGIHRIAEFIQKFKNVSISTEISSYILEAKKKFIEVMNNDFNTPEALAVIFELIRKINPILSTSSRFYPSENNGNKIKDPRATNSESGQVNTLTKFLDEINEVLGIIPTEERKIPVEVQALIEKREKFREEKNYEESDKIRAQIQALGWEVEDTVYGPLTVKG